MHFYIDVVSLLVVVHPLGSFLNKPLFSKSLEGLLVEESSLASSLNILGGSPRVISRKHLSLTLKNSLHSPKEESLFDPICPK
jgi:hypothetical protein